VDNSQHVDPVLFDAIEDIQVGYPEAEEMLFAGKVSW